MISPDIFYVEDDKDFAFILEHAITEVNQDLTLNIVDDGKTVLNKLDGFVKLGQKPKLILLDLNLPGLTGLDILKYIKQTPFLRYIPVILFSASDSPRDIKFSYEFGANAFVTKPSGYHDLVDCIKSVYDFWLKRHKHLN